MKNTLNTNLHGIIYILLAYICIGAINSLIRELSKYFDPFYLTFLRSFTCILIIIPIIIKHHRFYKFKFKPINIFKGVIDFISIPAWIMAIANMNISEVVAISFLTPLICAVLAIIFLRDKFTNKKWLALFIGFTGAIIVVNPDADGVNKYAMVALLTCILWATGSIMTKNLTTNQQPLIIVLYTNVVILLLSSPLAFINLSDITYNNAVLIFLLGLFALLAHYFIAKAFTLAKMSTLLPFDYTRLIFSTLFAYIFFGQVITLNTIVGSLIIIISSIYLAKKDFK